MGVVLFKFVITFLNGYKKCVGDSYVVIFGGNSWDVFGE